MELLNNEEEFEEKKIPKKFKKRIKVRRYWPEGLSPVTRIVPNKKKYKREKIDLRDIQDDYVP
jgi:hypothetical protein